MVWIIGRLNRCGLTTVDRERSRRAMNQALKNIIGKEAVGLYSGRGFLNELQTRQLGTNVK